MERIVINASPLILLCKTDLGFILPDMFSVIVIPNGVMNEIATQNDGIAQRLHNRKKFAIKETPLDSLVQSWDLGRGEAEVLSFASLNRDHTPVLDDAEGKACCQALGLKPLGTGSVLILAKRRGLIPSVYDALTSLREKGMWISDPVIQLICRKAGE